MFVRVEWMDAYVDYGRKTEEELKDSKPIARTSVGHLVFENDEVVVIAAEVLVIDSIIYYENSMMIPKGFVTGPVRQLRMK